MIIGIIDYKLGNLGSLSNILDEMSQEYIISSDPNELIKCEKLILSGVGSFDRGIKNLKSLKLDEFIINQVKDNKIKILGICLGFQILGKSSEEGILEGLNLIPINFKKFESNNKKVPHIGWNFCINEDDSIFNGELFYFVHSYYGEPTKQKNASIGYSCYDELFISYYQKDNVAGCQFHPEKSHDNGLKTLKNFVKW